MRIHHYRKTGDFHIHRGEECQDEGLWTALGAYDLAVLADGVSACGQGRRGARLACEAVADFIRMEKKHIFLYTPQKLAYLVIEHILYFLEKESALSGAAVSDYASTIAFICVDNESGKMIVFSLGDSAILHASKSKVCMIAGPKRYDGHPALTTTKDACQYVEIQSLTVSDGDSILLCTDGFLHAAGFDVSCRCVLQEAMLKQEFLQLDVLLDHTDEPDDMSYIHYAPTGG